MIAIEWSRLAIGHPPLRIVRDPRCPSTMDDGAPCGAPATVRVTFGMAWSLFWCPIHAPLFTIDWDIYRRLFPKSGDRAMLR